MAFIKVEKVAIRGISGCVPANVEENRDLPFYSSTEEAESVIKATGIERRHIVSSGVTASDLCLKAAERLIEELGWEKDSIDLIASCTQTPDYINQPNSFVIHEKLGLSGKTMCIDFFHGCPGWVVSLSSVSQMLSDSGLKRAILVDGDTASRDQDVNSREERPLFGDAGTATALEFDKDSTPIFFNIGTDSTSGRALTRELGGYRNPYTLENLKALLDKRAGIVGSSEGSHDMDSMDVFSFAITKAPKAIKKLCTEYEIKVENVDKFVIHQANKMIVETIAKRLKIDMKKVPICLKEYGNTTSASIPLTMVSECEKQIKNKKQKFIVCAFGTGLSWGAAYFETDSIICPEILVYE